MESAQGRCSTPGAVTALMWFAFRARLHAPLTDRRTPIAAHGGLGSGAELAIGSVASSTPSKAARGRVLPSCALGQAPKRHAAIPSTESRPGVPGRGRCARRSSTPWAPCVPRHRRPSDTTLLRCPSRHGALHWRPTERVCRQVHGLSVAPAPWPPSPVVPVSATSRHSRLPKPAQTATPASPRMQSCVGYGCQRSTSWWL